MNRYFFYMVLMTMIVNVMAFVPNILINQRFHGSLMGGICGVLISSLFTYIFSWSIIQFPGMGLPEILQQTIPSWMKNLLLLFFSFMWFTAGDLILVTFSIITKRFISPDLSLTAVLSLLMIVTGYTAVQSSKSQLYILEIMLIISAPFILFIMLKALGSKELMWSAILAMKYYIWKVPSFQSIAASSYTLIGYINMVVFHREFNGKFNTKYFWAIPFFGLFNLFTTLAIPIGFHGTEAVDDFPFPWVATADTMRLELAFIERVLFPFLLLYVHICLLFSSFAWHVAIQMLKTVFPVPKQSKWKHASTLGMICVFMIPNLLFIHWGTLPQIQRINSVWINIRFIAEFFLVGLLFYLAKRKGKVS